VSNSITIFAAATDARVDAEAGILRGVSIITEGEAKGHGMLIDSTTLEQVKACIEAFGADGVKVKVDHWSGFDGIVGTVKDCVIDGTQLRADLHLLTTHEATPQILEMASTMPSQFGLSIAFSGEPEDKTVDVDGVQVLARYARCAELYSVDLVDQPAANPTGLFSVPTEFERTFAASLKRIEKQNTELTTLRANLDEVKQEKTALAAKITELETAAATRERHITLLKAARGLVAATVVPPVQAPSSEPTDSDLYDRFKAADPTESKRLLEDPKLGPLIRAESRRRISAN
jgi:hypothetical protein